MPTIGEQLFPEVQPERPFAVYQTPRPQAGSFGGLTAEARQRAGAAIEQGGATAADIRIRFQHQENETAVDAANTAYDNRRREILFGEGGFYNKKGKDAYEAMKPTEQSIDELRQNMREGLKNPEQQRMFDTYSRRSTAMDLRSMAMHAAGENQKYRVGVAEAALGNTMAEITAYWNDPYRFAKGLGDIRVQAENRARLLGHSDPEQIKADVAHYEGQAWVARIKATMSENPLLAREMYEANKDQIHDVPQKVILEHEIKVAALPEEAKQVARGIVAGTAPGEPGKTTKVSVPGTPGAEGGAQAPLTARDTKAQLAAWLPAAEREAQRLHPGNQTFQDMVTTQVKGYVNTVATMQEALARQAQQTVMTAAVTPTTSGRKPMTLDDLLANPQTRSAWAMTTPDAQRGFLALLEHNARQANGEFRAGNPRLFNDLQRRIYLPEGDPNRVTSPTQITSYYADDKAYGAGLNYTQGERLRKEIAEAATPEGNPFLKQVNQLKGTARRMLLGSNRGIMHPDYAEEAAHRFGEDLDTKIKAARAAGRDPQELFNSGSKDYVLDINRVAAFMPTEADIRAGVRPKPAEGGGAAEKRKPGETPAQYLKRIGKE